MSWHTLKPVGEKIADELLATIPLEDSLRIIHLMRAALIREQCGDLAILADKLYKGLRGEFNTGATFMLIDAARRRALQQKRAKH